MGKFKQMLDIKPNYEQDKIKNRVSPYIWYKYFYEKPENITYCKFETVILPKIKRIFN